MPQIDFKSVLWIDFDIFDFAKTKHFAKTT